MPIILVDLALKLCLLKITIKEKAIKIIVGDTYEINTPLKDDNGRMLDKVSQMNFVDIVINTITTIVIQAYEFLILLGMLYLLINPPAR